MIEYSVLDMNYKLLQWQLDGNVIGTKVWCEILIIDKDKHFHLMLTLIPNIAVQA